MERSRLRLEARDIAIVSVMLLMTIGGAAFYLSPEESGFRPITEEEEVVSLARRVAYDLYLFGRVEPTSTEVILEPARSKASRSPQRRLPPEEIARRLRVSELTVEPPEFAPALRPEPSHMYLEVFQKKGDTFVLAFHYSHWETSDLDVVGVPGKGPLLFGTALKVVNVPNDSMLQRAWRKFANIPGIRNVLPAGSGSSWRLALVDYRLNADLTDLVGWLVKDRAALVEAARQDLESLKRQPIDPGYVDRMWKKFEEYERSGEADKWVGAAMESHFAQISSDLERMRELTKRWAKETSDVKKP